MTPLPALPDDRLLLRLVLTSYTYTAAHKTASVFRVVEDDATLGDTRVYTGKGIPTEVGSMWTVQALRVTPSTIYATTFTYAGLWPDAAARLAWQVAARTFTLQDRARKEGKKERTRNLLQDTMAPLRTLYLKTNYQNRAALELLVLHYLRTGEVLDE